ncbi:MAG: DUF2088 domain-containing protein [Candidatus Accumulibacter sp.]|jgi:hypothetical protein|nr:DUF2088 domain-containing protein [Azonexus sp.]MBP9805606.1 DUF2088 domain-containing protein [Accumulibacter sp.]
MQNVNVDCGTTQLEISVPGDATVLRCPEPPVLDDPAAAVRAALADPIGIGPIRSLVSPGNKVTIAFDAPPRSGKPRQIIIPILLEELTRCGVPEENVTLVCAGGTHGKIPPAGLLDCLGHDLFRRFWPDRLINHDCSQDLVYLGRSSRGDYVEYNRLLVDSDLTIYLGTIFPLNWGGFTGTGAVIGLGSARSIASHHTEVIANRHSAHGDHRTQHYRLHKEAINAQIEKGTGKPIFYVDVITNSTGDIAAVFAGHSPEINEPAWGVAEKLFRVNTPQADVLIMGIPYQAVYGSTDNPLLAMTYITTPPRTWLNKPLVRKGGVVIALGRSNGEYSNLRPSDAEVLERYQNCFRVQELSKHIEEFLTRPDYLYKYQHCNAYHPIHPFWLLYENQWLIEHASKVIMAGEVAPGPLRSLGLVPSNSFASAWQMAKEVVGDNPRVVVLPHYWTHLKMQFLVE